MSDPWKHITAHLPVLVGALDERGVLCEANDAFLEVLGRDPDDLVGTNVLELVHPDDVPVASTALREAFSRGVATSGFDTRMLHKDGSTRWISWNSPPPRDGTMVGFGLDVTARRREIQELELVRTQLNSVLETVPHYITRIKPDGEVEYINRTYPGVTPEQVIGTNLLNWLPPEHRAPMKLAIESVLAGETGVELIVEGTGADGGPTWYRSCLGALKRGDEVVSVILAGEDITESVMAEQRRTQSARLETAGRIAAAVAHDFNNDLMAMLLSVEILQQQPLDATVEEELGELHAAILKARATTRQLSQALRQPAEVLSTTELGEHLPKLASTLKRSAGDANELVIEQVHGPLHVPLASEELTRILTHLVDNSRQAMQKPGRIEISAALRTVEADGAQWLEPGDYVELAVTDDGPGIPQDQREKVFDPFFSTRPKAKGFGLATCCAIARARRGDITVSCPPTGGTKVALWFPAADTTGVLAPDVAEERVTSKSEAWTILLAEDHHYTRTRMTRYLSSLGHTVLSARDGLDALDMLERHPGTVDAVVTDLAMPGLDGASLLEKLRAERPAVALVAMSGNPEASDTRRLAPLGIRVLEKPILPGDLSEAVRRAIETAKALQAVE